MPMHPVLSQFALQPVLDVLFNPAARPQALADLQQRQLLDAPLRARWEAELERAPYSRQVGDLAAAARLLVDPLAQASGPQSPQSPMVILANLQAVLATAASVGRAPVMSAPALAGQTALDFGSGILYPLSASALLHANGYGQVISLEPFPLHPGHAAASLLTVVQAALQDPSAYCMFGQQPGLLKQRLAALDLSDLIGRLERFNRRDIDRVDLGGVVLVHARSAVAAGTVDLIFSNSVLEHVDDLPTVMRWQREVLKPTGLVAHTVDFADHRYYLDARLSMLEMVFDGVLEEINGLRPVHMETAFAAAGFAGHKLPRLQVPDAALADPRARQPRFAGLADHQLRDWVNGYLLWPQAVAQPAPGTAVARKAEPAPA